MKSVHLNRREFLRSSLSGSVWLLSLYVPISAAGKTATPTQENSSQWCIYVAIQPDNSSIIESPCMEMGQFMRTTGPMILAEEMDLDWDTLSFRNNATLHLKRDSDNSLVYRYVDMNSGGSHAVRWTWDYLRRAGALARQMLVQAAAQSWGVPANEITTQQSKLYHQASGRQAHYATFSERASKLRISDDQIVLKKPHAYRLIGRAKPNIDLHDIVTGKPRFGIDSDYPNCLQALIYRAPATGAQLVSVDKRAALAVPGVVKLIEIQRMDDDNWFAGNTQYIAAGIAIIATHIWAAIKARKLLKPVWKNTSKYAQSNSKAQMRSMVAVATSSAKAKPVQDNGDLETAFSKADIVIESIYQKPLFAHALMEPLNCIADIRKDSATIITGHQFPIRIAEEVERFTGIDATKVEVICTPMGCGLGRRAERDWVREAVLLAQELKAPVKVSWLREDEIERDLFDPASAIHIRAALKDGKITAWHHRQAQTKGGAQDSSFPHGLIENYKIELCDFVSDIPCGAWRGPQHPAWAFAAESMIDELAYAAKQDPLDFRMRLMLPAREISHNNWGANLKDSGRMARCYQRAADMAKWQTKRPKNVGLGIAGHFCHGSYAAFVIEVYVLGKVLKLRQAWGAIDCGLAINPNHIRAQMEGGFIDGLNAALFNEITIVDGAVQNNQFDSFKMGRMRHAPLEIHSDIITSEHPPTGVGEPPTAPAMAALVNAIYAASAKRIRNLPLMAHFELG